MPKLSGNNPLSVIARLSSEIAYVRARLCIRNAPDNVRSELTNAADCVENALKLAQDGEIKRIMSLTDEGVRRELLLEGLDPQEEAKKVRKIIDKAIKSCAKEIKAKASGPPPHIVIGDMIK